MGVDSIDYMVLTHPHPDHIQGLKYIAENFSIGEFWEGKRYLEIDEYGELMRILKRKNIPIRELNESTPTFNIGAAHIEPLAPFNGSTVAAADDYNGVNDESLVFRLEYGSFRVLFTGDIGNKTESALAKRPELLRCTVLKVPHHGSRHSSTKEFLKAASPQHAVVSSGYGNGYHLPSEETIFRLKAMGIKLHRTDLDGAILVIYDKMKDNAITIRHFR
jgi:competence protein ComEC